MTYIKKSTSVFLKSFKFDKSFWHSTLADFIFYLFLFLTGIFMYKLILRRVGTFSNIDATGLSIPQVGFLARSLMMDFYSFIFISVMLFVFFYCLFKIIVWSFLLKGKSMRKEYSQKFYLLSSIWLFFWILFLSFFHYILKINNIFFIFIILLIINYFTKILFISFVNKQDIKKAYNTMIDLAFKKFYLFCLPYLFELIVFIPLFFILSNLAFLSTDVFYFVLFLAFLLYSSWTRKYFSSVINTIKL